VATPPRSHEAALVKPPSGASAGTTPSGGELRRGRVQCGAELRDVARDLGVPSGDLRALEWDRVDLLQSPGYAMRLALRYQSWLVSHGIARPAPSEPDSA
jgi:hypothetical protein